MDKNLLDALAAKAEQRRAAKTQAKQFSVGGQMLDFVKIGHEAQLDMYEAFLEAREEPRKLLEVGVQAIYDCCPALQDPELHKALGVTDPYDAVWALMGVRDINVLSAKLFAWMGLITGDEDEDPVKN